MFISIGNMQQEQHESNKRALSAFAALPAGRIMLRVINNEPL
jgi:hypothetical protein